ncbi:MerR family transcriptional regulator [Streptomyces sp. RFCAC02]|uniref:MerR family transcriptional regulator n=1 Tax=Streptomyces sp. RFCAC02 TaxID=2499143 RepID=UPI0010215839|nr:MerR family transcriptional regulator [Streptomyces sp. RFCAC02]
MRIGELAALAGTTPRALRHYESLGLLASRRDANGYRTYDSGDLRLLRQIQALQAFGFGLEETRPFLDCLRAGHPSGDTCAGSLAMYRDKLAELEACIEELSAIRDTVRERLARAERAAPPAPPRPLCELTAHRPPA